MRGRRATAALSVALVALIACTPDHNTRDPDVAQPTDVGTDTDTGTDTGPDGGADRGTDTGTDGGSSTTRPSVDRTATTGSTTRGTDSTSSSTTEVDPQRATRIDARPVLLRTKPVGFGAALGGPRAYVTTVDDGRPVADLSIRFVNNPVEEVELCEATTNEQGLAICRGLDLTVGMVPGLQYTAVFAGDTAYGTSSDTGVIIDAGPGT